MHSPYPYPQAANYLFGNKEENNRGERKKKKGLVGCLTCWELFLPGFEDREHNDGGNEEQQNNGNHHAFS